MRRVYDVTNVLCSLNLLRKKAVRILLLISPITHIYFIFFYSVYTQIPKSKALEAEMHNNIDSPSSASSSLYSDSKASHGKAGKSAEKADAKVLEWVSFDVNVIRQRYMAYKG
ncbi:hypothetical protein EON63_14670 [archaeon]|nr:MAG: hypothetical protein EON63_14670 [archaeon]